MKDLILMILSAILVFGASVYVICLLLFRRRWFEVPEACGNVGDEE